MVTRPFGVGGLRALGAHCGSCPAEREGTVGEVDVWAGGAPQLSVCWVVLGPRLPLSDLKAGPRVAGAGLGACLGTRVCSPSSQSAFQVWTDPANSCVWP